MDCICQIGPQVLHGNCIFKVFSSSCNWVAFILADRNGFTLILITVTDVKALLSFYSFSYLLCTLF